MRKYFKVFTISIQNALEYKENFFCTIFFSMIPCITNLLMWYAIYKSGSSSLGMSLSEIICYYLFVLLVDNLTCNNIMWKVPQDIRYGDLNKYLVKPVNFRCYTLLNDISQNAIFMVMIGMPIIILLFLFQAKLNLHISIVNILFFIVALIIGYGINFLLNYLMCMLAFYMTDISSLCVSLDVLKGLVTGKVFPISLVPKALRSVLIFTPFQYICYFPVMILLNQYSVHEMISQSILGCIWVVVLYVISEIVWIIGLNKYSAIGG